MCEKYNLVTTFIQVQFSLALPRIMFYAKNTTWRSSWLEKMQENLDKVINPSC